MEKIFSVGLFLIIFCNSIFSQVPGKAFNPMTATGAKRISLYSHILFWQNPSEVVYNEVYLSDDSTLVANLNTSVKLLGGYPNTIYDSLKLSLLDTIINGTWYYWRIVEHNQKGSSIGDIWKFRTIGYNPYSGIDLTTGLSDWIIIDSSGYDNWVVNPDALIFNPYSFFGTSLIIYKKIFNFIFAELAFSTLYQHFFTGPFIGAGYSTNEGISWNSSWEIQPAGNFFSNSIFFQLPKEEVQIGFYFSGSSDGVIFWEISNINLYSIIYLLTPPHQLIALSGDSLKIDLNWSAGQFTPPDTIISYKIEKKNGLPNSSNDYSLIAEVEPHVLNYVDTDVSLGSIYTYRVSTTAGNYESSFSNDATAYVPTVVPVELINFMVNVVDEKVKLNWTTATETNNSGFEIERRHTSTSLSMTNWEKIGFVSGFGTTTEIKSYSFTDENVSSGIYKYRLKQIDYDGTFKYSDEVEIEVNLLPKEFVLEQNYPNPFNPRTVISLQLPVSSHVSLKVFDVLGNEIVTLIDENKKAGSYEVIYNVGQDSSPDIASGVYFYQLKTGGFVQTRKMILVK